jgi:5-formyltetrahydrofolate cyclo-ligase
MTKAELRNIYLEKRKSISDSEKMKADDLLLIRFQQMGFEDVQVLFSYYPMEKTAEPNTHIYTRYLHHMIPGLTVAYPVTDFSNNTMKAIETNDDTEFEVRRGLTEPVSGAEIDPADIDLIFVPFIVCDTNGFRVGYGKGFYDRFLAQCRPEALKIGFSYFQPVEPITDTHEYDVPLNYCITPDSIYEF